MTTRIRRYSLPQTSNERMSLREDEERERRQPLTQPTIEEVDEMAAEDELEMYWDDPQMPPPPDGGWGWVVVFASFMCNVIVDGIAYSFGIFFLKFAEAFDETKGKTAWVGSLLSGCYLIVGPIVSALTNRYGCRPVTIAGSIFGCGAFLLSTLSPNLNVLMITYGIMGGIGFGLIYLPAIVSVGYYFEKKRAFATGIAVCGSGVGTFVFAPLSQQLLELYGWRGSLMILAGLILNCTVFGALMRPLELKPIKEDPNQKPLLQRIAEEKKWQMERGSIAGSQYFMVQLPDGTMERRLKYPPLNMEPGVHSSFNLDQFGKIPETPVSAMPLPTIAENGKLQEADGSGSGSSAAESTAGSRVKMTIGSGSVVDCGQETSQERTRDSGRDNVRERLSMAPRPSLVMPMRVRVQNGIPKNYSVPILEGLARRNGILRQDSFVKLSQSNITMNGDLRKQSLRLKVSSNSLAGQGGGSSRNNNYSVEEVWVKVGEGGLGSTITVTEKPQKPDPKEYSRPMYRKDIFYSGSIRNLPEYSNSQRDLNLYRNSVTSIPRTSVVVLQTAEADGVPPQVVMAKLEETTACSCLPGPMRHTFAAMLDLSLIMDPVFLLIGFSNVLGMLGFYVPFVYITDCATKKGVPADQASYLLSVIGITNTIGRILAGWLTDRPNVDSLLVNNVCLGMSGVAVFVIPFCPGYITLILIAVCFGLFISAYISLTSIILVDLLGLDRLTNAFGLLILFRGAASVVGAPLAGSVFDATGSYNASFFIAGGLIMCSSALSFLIPCVKRRQDRKYMEEELRRQSFSESGQGDGMPHQEGQSLGQIETAL